MELGRGFVVIILMMGSHAQSKNLSRWDLARMLRKPVTTHYVWFDGVCCSAHVWPGAICIPHLILECQAQSFHQMKRSKARRKRYRHHLLNWFMIASWTASPLQPNPKRCPNQLVLQLQLQKCPRRRRKQNPKAQAVMMALQMIQIHYVLQAQAQEVRL